MQRIKIEQPASYPFATKLRIRITDLNYGNHVGNDAFLALIHEARMQFLQWHGYSELNIGGFGLIMADAAIEFKAELHYADEVDVAVGPGGCSRVAFDLVYRIMVMRESGSQLAALAKTGMVLFDYETKKPVAIPDLIREKLGLPLMA
jgi:acyl-CoA thioesterase FadM